MVAGEADGGFGGVGVWVGGVVVGEADAACWVLGFWGGEVGLAVEIMDEASGAWALGGDVEVDAGRV